MSSATQTLPALPSLYDFFAPGGVLSRSQFPYEFRRGQYEMAQAVESALTTSATSSSKPEPAPARPSPICCPPCAPASRVIISTGTKNLQEQLFFKDVPFLESLLGPLRVCYMKGRANYLCSHKLYALRNQPLLTGLEEISQYQPSPRGRRPPRPATAPRSTRCPRPASSGPSSTHAAKPASARPAPTRIAASSPRCAAAPPSPTSSSSTTTSSSPTSPSSCRPGRARCRHPSRSRHRHLRRSARARRRRLQLLRHRPQHQRFDELARDVETMLRAKQCAELQHHRSRADRCATARASSSPRCPCRAMPRADAAMAACPS